jgi:hypothetical protein
MSKEKVLGTLKKADKKKKPSGKTKQIMDKIKEDRRLSSKEFWNAYDAMWRKGPDVKFLTSDTWVHKPTR